MIKIERPLAPDFLTKNYQRWGIQYQTRRNKNPNAIFFWTTYKRTRINKLLLPILMKMTSILGEEENAHCSFCDGFPIQPVSANSIEHFRPKSLFPLLAYAWENLFYCCSKCQESKLEDFDERLLKPDVLDYSFEYYFQYDSKTGKIVSNPDRLESNFQDFQRAEKTIELYGLNEHGRPMARKRTIRQYEDSNNPILDEFPYRYILNYLQ
jgi:uncharacterized protein (TIGR02646 family)